MNLGSITLIQKPKPSHNDGITDSPPLNRLVLSPLQAKLFSQYFGTSMEEWWWISWQIMQQLPELTILHCYRCCERISKPRSAESWPKETASCKTAAVTKIEQKERESVFFVIQILRGWIFFVDNFAFQLPCSQLSHGPDAWSCGYDFPPHLLFLLTWHLLTFTSFRPWLFLKTIVQDDEAPISEVSNTIWGVKDWKSTHDV